MDRVELEQKIDDTICKTQGFFLLARVTPQFLDKSPIAGIIFTEADDYLDLLKEIIDNGRKDLISKFGISLLAHHNVLALCINYLTLEAHIPTPEELVSKYDVFHRFRDLLLRVEYEDILNDKSGLWHTYKL